MRFPTSLVPAYCQTAHLKRCLLALTLAVLILTALPPVSVYALDLICYVKADAAGANDGSSWTNAFTDLQSALGTSTCTEMWVAAGTYKPTSGTDRVATFQLKDGVALYGGFSGTETGRDQRDWSRNLTLLSGDLGLANYLLDNSYHVVTGANNATLDGFTVTEGYTNTVPDLLTPHRSGAGMYNLNSSPTVTNVIFFHNGAQLGGPGMHNVNSSPVLTRVTFRDNWTEGMQSKTASGSALFNDHSNPTLIQVNFVENYSNLGSSYRAALYNFHSNPIVRDSTFANNPEAIDNDNSSPLLTNVTILSFLPETGQIGITNYSNSHPVLTNVTFKGYSYALYNWAGGTNTTTLNNTVVDGGCNLNGSSITNGGGNVFSSDTCSVTPSTTLNLGSLSDNGGPTGTIPLLAGSAAIGAGVEANCPATDQRGQPRGGACDSGAYEYTTTPFVTTLTASGQTSSGASLHGLVNANGASASLRFEYGPDTSYGSTVNLSPASGKTDKTVTATLSGLAPNTTYHARLVAAVSGVSYPGADVSFTTLTASNNAALSSLTLSSGALAPAFAAGTLAYTDAVAYNVTNITVTPTVAESHAAITVNGTAVASGSASGAIALAQGENTIPVVVTAQDGTTTRTYTLTVTRGVTYADPAGLCSGHAPCYSSLRAAIAGGSENGLVQVYGGTYTEDVTIPRNMTVSLAGDLTLHGSLTLAQGTFQLGFRSLDLSGDFTNQGSFQSGLGTLALNGSTPQILSGAATTFYDLTINNPAGVDLTLNATVAGTLTLQDGALGVYSKTFTILGATMTGGGSMANLLSTTVYSEADPGQAVAPGQYGHLVFNNQPKTLPDGGTVAIQGNFDPGAAGGHTVSGSTLSFNGSGEQVISNDVNLNNIQVGTDAILTTSAAVTYSGTLTNLGWIQETHPVSGLGTLSFGLAGASIAVTQPGTLATLEVMRRDQDHPNRTAAIESGRYWTIQALNASSQEATGFLTSLTLPKLSAVAANDTLCRWETAAWNCAGSSINATLNTVTRVGIDHFSDWALGKASPTAVNITNLAARPVLQGVQISWSTAQEVDLLGFHIYRSPAVGGERLRLTENLVPASTPGGLIGSPYNFVDTTAAPGLVYQYWLETVSTNGSQFYGPIPGAAASNWLYLPFLQKP